MRKITEWLGVRYLRLQQVLRGEEGLETLEWVALAAVFAILIMGILAIFGTQAKSLGDTIFKGIESWAKNIGMGK